MGKIKAVLEDWLDNYGNDLGYDMTNSPSMKDWDDIRINKTTAKEYYHIKSGKKAILQEDLRIKYGAPEPPEVFEDE